MWAKGKAIDPTSSSDMAQAMASPRPPVTRVMSVWRTPLGSEVVPEV
jgi:hypothetical protein